MSHRVVSGGSQVVERSEVVGDEWRYEVCCFVILIFFVIFFFFQAEDGIRDWSVTGVQTCALPILFRNGWFQWFSVWELKVPTVPYLEMAGSIVFLFRN